MSDSDKAVEQWKEETTAFDRVSSVAQTVSKPRPVSWIADEAAVAPNTARKHLQRLEKLHVVREVPGEDATRYEADPLYLRFEMLRDVLDGNDLDDLVEMKADYREQIESWQSKYSANTPDELRELAADKSSAEEIREIRKAASDWELVASRLSVVEEAIEHYDGYTTTPAREESN